MRHRTTSFRTMLLATAALTPLVVQAQTTAGSSQSGVADAVRVLMDQATYWQGKYQPEKADEALSRVLSLDPRNADALALQAQTAADRGDQQLARSALSKLQAARPDDPRIQTIEQSMRLGPIDPNTLAQARQLAAAGKGEEAVAAYRKVFRGSVPPAGLATEYYQVLSNTDGNFDAGRNGLADLLRANPDDLRAQLAYAELLTYRDGTRDEGLARLERLVTNPTIADQANRDLKQTLLWLPISQASVPAMQAYLARFPNDKDIQQRVELARNDIGGLRVEGFDALEANQTGAAESAFTRALAKAPNDSDSLIGMALVRLKQRRPADARALLQHAIEIDPDKAAQYQPLIDSTDPKAIARASATGGNNGGNTDYGAAAARKIRAQYAEVAALTQHGEFAQAEAHLRALMGRKPNFGNYLQLADIQARAGKLAQSEASYRTALRSQPRNVAALGGLAGVLAREGQTDEANRIFAQLGRSGGGGSVAQTRAASLRQQAQQSSDPAQQDQLYRSAVAADPADPWLRLEFARLLEGQNRDPEAQQVMADVTAAPHPTADQLRAAVYFADGNHNPAQTLALLNRIPEKARTPEMRDVAVRAGVAQDLRSAKDGNSINVARLIALAAQPDPTGLRGASFAQALVKAGNKVGARDVIRAALAARPVQPQQRIAYAGALLGAGFPDDAQHLTQPVQPAALTPLDRSRLAEVRDNAAVFSADNLNGRGETADAYDQLAPRLAREPENPSLNMALARLYEANRQPREALRIAESVLQRNPSNVSAFQSTVGAAIAAGDLRRARSLADQAKSQFPDDPQAWLMSAQVSRADGEDNRALTELRTAKNLRRQQIDASDRQGLFDRSNVVGGTGPRYAQNVPANTMTDVGASGYAPFVHDSGAGAEPVTREYAQYVPPGETAPPKFSNSNPASGTVAGRPAALPPLESSPLQTAQNFQSDTAAYTNPFRPSPVPTIDEPATSTDVLGRRTNANSSSTDALTQDIDQSIAQVQQNVAPRVEASLSLRGRSSELGGGTLLDVEAPVEASFSPAGVGRLKVQVTPVYLNSSGGDSGAIAQYGTNPVLAPLASLVPGGISSPATHQECRWLRPRCRLRLPLRVGGHRQHAARLPGNQCRRRDRVRTAPHQQPDAAGGW